MKKVIAVINQKGGVGKSTISVNLAYELSLCKNRTLLIDMDPQSHSSCIFCPNIEKEKTITAAFTDSSTKIQDIVLPATVNEGQRHNVIENLSIIPSDIKLALAAEQINMKIYKERMLHKHIESLSEDFDFTIIDCPPTLGVLAINAIYAADWVIIPTNYGRYSLDGMADLIKFIREVKESQKYSLNVLRNLYDRRTTQTNRYIEEQLEPLREQIFGTVIRKNEAINQSQINNLPVKIFNPSCNGSQDFFQLSEEVILNAA